MSGSITIQSAGISGQPYTRTDAYTFLGDPTATAWSKANSWFNYLQNEISTINQFGGSVSSGQSLTLYNTTSIEGYELSTVTVSGEDDSLANGTYTWNDWLGVLTNQNNYVLTFVTPQQGQLIGTGSLYLTGSRYTQSAVNNLTASLKSCSLWDKFVGVYPFAAATVAGDAANLKGSSYTLQWNGAYANASAHTLTGLVSDGNSYADTGIIAPEFLIVSASENCNVNVFLSNIGTTSSLTPVAGLTCDIGNPYFLHVYSDLNISTSSISTGMSSTGNTTTSNLTNPIYNVFFAGSNGSNGGTYQINNTPTTGGSQQGVSSMGGFSNPPTFLLGGVGNWTNTGTTLYLSSVNYANAGQTLRFAAIGNTAGLNTSDQNNLFNIVTEYLNELDNCPYIYSGSVGYVPNFRTLVPGVPLVSIIPGSSSVITYTSPSTSSLSNWEILQPNGSPVTNSYTDGNTMYGNYTMIDFDTFSTFNWLSGSSTVSNYVFFCLYGGPLIPGVKRWVNWNCANVMWYSSSNKQCSCDAYPPSYTRTYGQPTFSNIVWETIYSSVTLTCDTNNNLCADGNIVPVIIPNNTILSSTASTYGYMDGGLITMDNDYIYICSGLNSWKRIALDQF
jgi:hypothetical protein